MQEEIRTKDDFLERTVLISERLGVSLRGLAPIMGMSVASLFGYRSGQIPISNKAWHKLEAAEKAAGMGEENQETPANKTSGELSADERLERVEAQLAQVLELLEQVLARDAAPKMSSVARGKSA